MSASLRSGWALGLVIVAATTVWWLASTRLALQSGAPSLLLADRALAGLALARAMVLCVFALRTGSLAPARSAIQAGLLLTAAAWPLVLLCWSAANVLPREVLAVELGLFVWAAILAVLGRAIARVLEAGGSAAAVSTSLGLLLACGLWLSRHHWLVMGGSG